ncbi:MAG: hypothetical protein JW850_07850 [Thermoflexales bacterium]|nr:hypothetical protein [Thermoflexales bacterium]
MSSQAKAPVENFDVNSVTIGGVVTRVWSRHDDVYASLVVHGQYGVLSQILPFGNKDGDSHHLVYATIMLPGGKTAEGMPVSLAKKGKVRVSGYIREVPYAETLGRIKQRAGVSQMDEGDDDVTLGRISTCTVVKTIERNSEPADANLVEIGGVVTKVWTKRDNVCARLAVYDQFSEILSPAGKRKLPRRKAHYVTIMLPGGKTSDGLEASIAKNDRLRATGFMCDVPYIETLRQVKVRAGLADRVADDDGEIRLRRIASYAVVGTLVQFG